MIQKLIHKIMKWYESKLKYKCQFCDYDISKEENVKYKRLCYNCAVDFYE